jgi:hypothetical protein
METKKLSQTQLSIMLIMTIILSFTACKKKETITPSTNTTNQLTGVWTGTLKTNDPVVGSWVDYTLTVDFTLLTASSTCYGYGQIVGIVKIISTTTIDIDWPQCGYETVSFTISNGTLSASGSEKAYSDGRITSTIWTITKQSNNQLTAVWSGTLKTNDPVIGHWVDYTLNVDFTGLTAHSTCYGYGQIVGIVKIISSTTIEINWPQCGYETVSYTVNNRTLTASGSEKAYSDDRITSTIWNITKQ